VSQLDLSSILADGRRFALFESPDGDHLLIGVLLIDARARTAGTIGDTAPGKPAVGLVEAGRNPVVRHKFLIIGMRADTKVRRARQRLRHFVIVRHKEFGIITTEWHHRLLVEMRSQDIA